LSVQSVRKHYRAYEDIAWDAPEMQIDPKDPRFELGPDEGLGRTQWYRDLPQETRARIGLSGTVGAMKLGVVFESVLKRGLLEFAAGLPNRSEEFRYAYHEVIEEAHHSLMFQELINRSGLNPAPMPRALQRGTRYVVRMARVFPELFFFFVLGGEEPIDFAQKQTIKSGRTLHPLVKRIMQIHITEEARHLCFARNYLQRTVPRLSAFNRLRLRVALPVLLGIMAKMMLQPSSAMIRRYQIPTSVIRQAYDDNPDHKRKVRASLAGRDPGIGQARVWLERPPPVEWRPVRKPSFLLDGPAEPQQEVWFRFPPVEGGDPLLHRVLLAYASDLSLLDVIARTHGLPQGRAMLASLDHAVWFQRHARVDEWLLFAQESPAAAGARGLARGMIYTRDGRLVASVAQEGLMRRVGALPGSGW